MDKFSSLPYHIFFLVHGNNGSPEDFDNVESIIRQKFRYQVLIIKSKENFGLTQQGIAKCGTRLSGEIISNLLKYPSSDSTLKHKVSIISHSLGGLFSRFAIKHVMDYFEHHPLGEKIDYCCFVTLCTPHLGSRRPRGPKGKTMMRLGVHTLLSINKVYGPTGTDLLLENDENNDKFEDMDNSTNSKSLLQMMSSLDSPYLIALKEFNSRTVVAMTDGDYLVPFSSASIRNVNPYPKAPLNRRAPVWDWLLTHSGFSCDLQNRLFNDCSAHAANISILEGTQICKGPRYFSDDGFECDNRQEVEFLYPMLRDLQSISWRRLDLSVEAASYKGIFRLHDWPIGKNQEDESRSSEFISLLGNILLLDHGRTLDNFNRVTDL